MPPDTYSFGKALGSTDGTGREVRFSFTTAISPEWDYMDDKAVVRPGFTENYYRFFMRAGLMWDDVIEMLNYGVGIAFHDVNTLSVDVPDSIRAHFVSSQRIVLDRLAGRGCKMLIEPNGNKAYVAAAEGYDPIQTIFLQSGGEKLRPFAVNGDLLRTRIERGLWLPAAIPAVIEAQMARPVEEREAVNIGVHGTDRSWSEMLLWLNNTYGRDGEDCLWMPAAEEYFEYNYLRHHAVVNAQATENTLTLTVEMPGGLYFYYPSLTINLLGVDPGACTAVGGGIVRDVILGVTPPATFHDPVYTLTAAAVSVLMFLPHVRARVGRHEPVFDRLLLVMDAVGLGVFTVVGVQCAYRQAEHDTLFLTVFVGLITGVGGGVLRDVFSGERPYIFVRHFYACASIIGALICALCWNRLGANAAMLFGAAAIVVLRLLAAYYHWSLPKSDYHDDTQTPTALRN